MVSSGGSRGQARPEILVVLGRSHNHRLSIITLKIRFKYQEGLRIAYTFFMIEIQETRLLESGALCYAKARAQRRRRQGHPPHRKLAVVVVVRIKRNLPRASFVPAPFQYRIHSEIKKESSSSSPHPLCFLPVASAPNVGAKGPCSQPPYCGCQGAL